MSVEDLSAWRVKLAKRSGSKLQSRVNGNGEEPGLRLTEEDLAEIEQYTQEMADVLAVYAVLDTARKKPFTVKSKFAREMAEHVAFCASASLITTQVTEQIWGYRWQITVAGRRKIEELQHELNDFLGETDPPI